MKRPSRNAAAKCPAQKPPLKEKYYAARTVIFVLLFTSGFTGLVYEVLWMKELGLLFGNTTYAVATTLASFFLGLAAGGYVWGRRSNKVKNPLRTYALLEACVAGSALFYFLLLAAYRGIYGPLFEIFENWQNFFIIVKFALALGVLFPPAFFMGGTLPMMSQHLVRRRDELGQTASALYAINTLGAVIGAYMAGFHLPPLIGFNRAYLGAIVLTLAVATAAFFASRRIQPSGVRDAEPVSATAEFLLSSRAVHTIAFLSGFVTLSLEVLWTRMFAQVLQNSVYTFSAILVLFLLCLALGALVASGLARLRLSPRLVVLGLAMASALTVSATPFIFNSVTGGLGEIGVGLGWHRYIIQVFGAGGLVIFLPSLLLGTVLPYLIKLSESFCLGAGRTVGDLVAVNTVGAILGSLLAGFAFLDLFGIWNSILLMGGLYLTVFLFLPGLPHLHRILPASGIILMLLVFHPSRLPLVHADPANNESVLEVWQGSGATVAVVLQQESLKIKVNNFYAVGGTGALKWEAWQSHLPPLIHPKPRSVFFLGMGTGITAGAALSHPVERVVVTEIVPEVVTAARNHFGPYTNNLFEDRRAKVVTEDGRNYLLGTNERYDVIVADLFMPWKAGIGTLYSLEHFAAAREKLDDVGVFVQWLPLYQMSRSEFGVIARTMLAAFPQVTLWRGDFFSQGPIMALVGQPGTKKLDPLAIHDRIRQSGPEIHDLPLRHFIPEIDRFSQYTKASPEPGRFLIYYCGNLSEAGHLFDKYDVNSDDWPILEYRAPISQRKEASGSGSWFVTGELIDFLEQLLETVPPQRDPYLEKFSGNEVNFVRAGLNFHRMQVLEITGDRDGARRAFEEFSQIVLTGSGRE